MDNGHRRDSRELARAHGAKVVEKVHTKDGEKDLERMQLLRRSGIGLMASVNHLHFVEC